MRQVILILLILRSYFEVFAGDTLTNLVTPRELSRQIITAFQAGQAGQLKLKLSADIVILEKGARDYHGDPLIHFALATCYLCQDKYQPAITNMEIAYTNSSKDVSVGVMYALALKMNMQPLKAYELDKEMLALHPGIPQLEISMATLEITIQKYDEALALIEVLLQKAPENLQALDKSVLFLMQGTCYLYKGNRAKAIELLQKDLSLTPNMAMDLTVLGEAFLKNGDLEKANEVLDKALAINQTIASALYYKGIIFEKAGNSTLSGKYFQDALIYGKQRLQDNGDDYYLMYLLCQKLSKADEGEKYKAEAEKLLFTHEAPWKHM